LRLYSLAAMLRRYLPMTNGRDRKAWKPEWTARPLRRCPCTDLPPYWIVTTATMPSSAAPELIESTGVHLGAPDLARSLGDGWSLARGPHATGAIALVTPMTRIRRRAQLRPRRDVRAASDRCARAIRRRHPQASRALGRGRARDRRRAVPPPMARRRISRWAIAASTLASLAASTAPPFVGDPQRSISQAAADGSPPAPNARSSGRYSGMVASTRRRSFRTSRASTGDDAWRCDFGAQRSARRSCHALPPTLLRRHRARPMRHASRRAAIVKNPRARRLPRHWHRPNGIARAQRARITTARSTGAADRAPARSTASIGQGGSPARARAARDTDDAPARRVRHARSAPTVTHPSSKRRLRRSTDLALHSTSMTEKHPSSLDAVDSAAAVAPKESVRPESPIVTATPAPAPKPSRRDAWRIRSTTC
jgi:hypothetical protein